MNSTTGKTNDFESSDRALELLQRFYDRTIGDEEADELLEIWNSRPETEREARNGFYVENSFRLFKDSQSAPTKKSMEALKSLAREKYDVECDLADVDFSNIGFTPFFDADELARLAADSETRTEEVRQKSPPKREMTPYRPTTQKESRRSLILAAVVLAFIFTCVYLEFYPHSVEPEKAFVEPVFLAEVVSAVDVRVAPNDPPVKQGLRLETDRLRFESGTVELEISNGVRLVLEGPVDFKLNSAMKTLCNVGRLSVFVPPEGKGFEVATPHLTVQDLGTEFFVNVTEKESELHVVKGEVLTNLINVDWIPFSGGQAMRIDGVAVKPTRFIAEPKLFVDKTVVQKRLTDFLERRQNVWQRELSRRSADTSLIFSLDRATPHGVERVAGMHPNNEALRFDSVRDYAEMSIPGEHRNMTLLAVVRLDTMKNYASLLCIGDGFPDEPGRFVWQLERTGELLFHIRDAQNVRNFNSPVVIKPGDWKSWMLLAVVADADQREVRHFVDGRRIATLPWLNPLPLRMNTGTLGNERPEKRKKTIRCWNGEIDEFDVYSRALSDAEIAETYENLY